MDSKVMIIMKWLSNHLKCAGWLHLLAHILCISFFSAQMFGLVEHLVAPKMTHTHVREVPLKDIDFPLEFKICVSPSMNSTVLNEFGYDTIGSYVAGISSRTNYSSVGWGGHVHGINLTSVREVFNRATLNVTRDLLQYVTFRTN